MRDLAHSHQVRHKLPEVVRADHHPVAPMVVLGVLWLLCGSNGSGPGPCVGVGPVPRAHHGRGRAMVAAAAAHMVH